MTIKLYNTIENPVETNIPGITLGLRVEDFSNVSARNVVATGRLGILIESENLTISTETDYVFGETSNPRNGLSAMTTEGIEDVIQKLFDEGEIDAKQKRLLRTDIVETVEATVNLRYGLDAMLIDLTNDLDRQSALNILDSSPKGKERVVMDGEVKSIPAQEYQAHQLQEELEQARQARMG